MITEKHTKTCFLISPIGAEGSDARKMADDFMELLIEPALQPYGFEIVRADKIASSSPINSDVIRYVQSSDLCIIDLTTQNPNVFYECGRRHENGRPFIQLIRKGESLPFDVAGIRTITYDLSSPRATLQSTREIQGFVERMEQQGYEAGSTGESLSSIADGIRRIERELGHLESEILGDQNIRKVAPAIKDILAKHPITAFNEAYDSGNIDLAVQLLPRIRRLLGDITWLQAANNLAAIGEPAGEEVILNMLQSPNSLDYDLILLSIYSLRQYYFNRNLSEQGAQSLADVINGLQDKLVLSDKQKADLIAQLALFQYSERDVESALKTALGVLKLSRDAVNLANVAFYYSEIGKFDEAIEYIDEFIKMPDIPQLGIETAIRVYQHFNRFEDVKLAQELLIKNTNKIS